MRNCLSEGSKSYKRAHRGRKLFVMPLKCPFLPFPEPRDVKFSFQKTLESSTKLQWTSHGLASQFLSTKLLAEPSKYPLLNFPEPQQVELWFKRLQIGFQGFCMEKLQSGGSESIQNASTTLNCASKGSWSSESVCNGRKVLAETLKCSLLSILGYSKWNCYSKDFGKLQKFPMGPV